MGLQISGKDFNIERINYGELFMKTWTHPGGKLRELGAESLTDSELLSILISTGTKEKSAEDISKEILDKFRTFKGMAGQPLEKFLDFKGLGV
jgi:DNA repair protein RadC